jgi:HSP20 family molecular chaperone IbpA
MEQTMNHEVPTSSGSPAAASGADTHAEPVILSPRVDVLTSPTTVRVRADLPGVTAEAVELSLHRGALHIDGLAASQRFRRTVHLSWPIDGEAAIDARLVDGVLTVDLVRRDAPRPARRLAVS